MFEGATPLTITLLVVCVLASAFFSSAEAAFLSVQRVRIRHLANSGAPGAALVARMVEHPERLLPTVLVGNNLVNTGAAALGTLIAVAFLTQGEAALAATIGVGSLLLVWGETVPKVLAARHAERVARLYARPLLLMEQMFFPLVVALHGISRGAVRLLGGGWDQGALVTEEEIKTMISVGREAGAVEHREAEMLYRVFRFGDRQVQEVMTPRTEAVWVEQGTTLGQFLAMYSHHPYTRFPVGAGSVDNVTGILSVKEVLIGLASGDLHPEAPITPLARPAHFVPETKLVGALFTELQQLGQPMAMVVDEFGGIAGLVTLKQLAEEIVGRVGEEGGLSEAEYEALDENTYRMDGGLRVEEANEKLGLDIPEGDYETVAGFLLNLLRRIPRERERVRYRDLHFTVTQMRGVKIEKIVVRRPAPAGPSRGAGR